jgi:hypothetical protein
MVAQFEPLKCRPAGDGAKLLRVRTLQATPVLAASGVDWSEVHAVRLLGVALGALILFWAIRRMFGRK